MKMLMPAKLLLTSQLGSSREPTWAGRGWARRKTVTAAASATDLYELDLCREEKLGHTQRCSVDFIV